MSHLVTTVDGNTADSVGDIDLSLSGVLDVSPTNGDTPTYTTSWGASEFNPQTRVLYYSFFFQFTGASGTHYSYDNNEYFVWRTGTSQTATEFKNSTGVTLNKALASNSPFNSNGTFKQSVTLSQSGTYLFILVPAFGDAFASNDSLNIRMSDGSDFGSRLHISTEGKFGDALFAIRTITTSKTFRFVISGISGTVDVMEGTPRDFCSINIYKIQE